MYTKFGKRLIASGMAAVLGAGVLAVPPAVAGPDRERDRGYHREDRQRDGHRRGRDHERRQERADSRHSKRGWDHDGRQARHQDERHEHRRHEGRGPARHDGSVHWRSKPHRGPVKIVREPVVVKKTVVVEKPRVIHQRVVHAPPVYKVHDDDDYRRAHRPRAHYGPPPYWHGARKHHRYHDGWGKHHYRNRHRGYGHYHRDEDAYPWLAFTAITVALISNLTEYQQRAYEDAQVRATMAPIGEPIYWRNADAYGTVIATREGTSSFNRYCREFQKTVTIGGRTEQAYGTACMQPDGAWEVVSDGYR